MKSFTKRLSILLVLTLIFTSVEFMSVFAGSEDGNATQGNPIDQGDVQNGDGTENGDDPEDPPAVELKAPAAPAVQTFSSYESVVLEWPKVTKDVDGNEYGEDVTVRYRVDGRDIGTSNTYHSPYNIDPLSSRTFKVEAYINDGEKELKTEKIVSDSPVRPMRYMLTVKRSGKLKSHGGPKQTYKVSKGTIIYADRFQTGKYIFDHNGSRFQVARTRIGKKAAEYTTSFDYSRKEAEYYVNDRGLGSSTGVLIWVNTYTQHVYYFDHNGSRWVCTDDWDCSTGTASTPTPSGTNGLKSIKKKIKKKNGIKYWSTFNGNAALHGRKKGKAVGYPASNGCVRNPDDKAWTIYTYAGKKTRVVIY